VFCDILLAFLVAISLGSAVLAHTAIVDQYDRGKEKRALRGGPGVQPCLQIMPPALLPASAAAFAPRASPTIVLDGKAEAWLTQTLKRANRTKRSLSSAQQQHRTLLATLSAPSAIWTLASIMLPNAPHVQLLKDDDPLLEAISNYKLLRIEAYVVHIDMVAQREVAFKLTVETIQALTVYHKHIYCVDAAANTPDWSDKSLQLRKLQNAFVHTVNRYVYRTDVHALEALEEDGAGELLQGRSAEVKAAIMAMFQPLLPPPPPVSLPAYIYPSTMPSQPMYSGPWWPIYEPLQQQFIPLAMPESDSWPVQASSPAPTSTDSDLVSLCWSSSGVADHNLTSPSPSDSIWIDAYVPQHPPIFQPNEMIFQEDFNATPQYRSINFSSDYAGYENQMHDVMPQVPVSI